MTKIINFLFLAVITLMPSLCSAISLQDLQVKELDKVMVAEFNDYNDATLMKVKYTGDETTAVINFSSGTLSIDAPVGTAILSSATIDYSNAAVDTLGELCDYINAQTDIECSLVGGKRNDSSGLLWNPLNGQNIADSDGYSVAIGTGGYQTDEKYAYVNRVGITPQSGRRVLLKYCVATTDGTGDLRVYGKLRKYETSSDGVTRDDTTEVLRIASVDDTEKTFGNIYSGYWLEFGKDEHVVISAGNASTAQTSTSSMQCFWDEK